MSTVTWRCTSCTAQGVGQGQSHVDQTLHAVMASQGEPFARVFCKCGHNRVQHAWRFEAGHVGRCLVFESCPCQSYQEAA